MPNKEDGIIEVISAPVTRGFLFVGGWVDLMNYERYNMQDKLIGFFGLMILMIGAIAYALFVEGAAGSFLNFTSIPSFLFVIAFGGLTYIKKDKYKFHKLGSVLKKDLILGGWMGFIVGLILLLAATPEGLRNNWEGGISAYGANSPLWIYAWKPC